VDNRLLEDGLSIISQCKSETGDIWQAHFGAAAIASYFFVKNHVLPRKLADGVFSQSRAMVEKNSVKNIKPHYSGYDLAIADNIILGALDKTITSSSKID
jgi:hypothetical protein